MKCKLLASLIATMEVAILIGLLITIFGLLFIVFTSTTTLDSVSRRAPERATAHVQTRTMSASHATLRQVAASVADLDIPRTLERANPPLRIPGLPRPLRQELG